MDLKKKQKKTYHDLKRLLLFSILLFFFSLWLFVESNILVHLGFIQNGLLPPKNYRYYYLKMVASQQLK